LIITLKNKDMKISLTEYDLKTLEEKEDGWSYRLNIRTGDIVGSGFPSPEEALKHAESNLLKIIRPLLKK
jgi:hypothetical protein